MTYVQPNQRRPASEGKFTGRHMLIVMIAFFGVIVSVNLTMAVLAGRSWTGLVVKNSYVASQHFNEDLRSARAQKQRGWRSSLAYRHGEIEMLVHNRSGEPVGLDALVLKFGRPAFEQADRTVVLSHVGNGVYRAPVTLKAGIWALSISGGTGESRYRRESRIRILRDGASGKEE